MIESAAALFSERGSSATSFADVIEESGAPRGSIYHHFPEGKQQLAAEAIRWTRDRVLAYLEADASATPDVVLARFISLWRRVVIGSSARAGCAIAGAAVDTNDDGVVLLSVRNAFRSWTDALAARFVAVGMPTARAESLATTALAAMEGALILCRAERDAAPLERIAAELLRLV